MRQNASPDAASETTTVVSASSSGHKTPAGAKDEASDASPGQTTVTSSSSSGNNAAPRQTTVVPASSSGDAQDLSFGFVDTNGDGIIDEEEFKAFLDARKGQTMQYGASLVRVSGAVCIIRAYRNRTLVSTVISSARSRYVIDVQYTSTPASHSLCGGQTITASFVGV